MIAAMALPGNSSTFLTHMVAHGLKVDWYVAERFQAMADGDIRRWKTPFLPILLHGAVSRPPYPASRCSRPIRGASG